MLFAKPINEYGGGGYCRKCLREGLVKGMFASGLECLGCHQGGLIQEMVSWGRWKFLGGDGGLLGGGHICWHYGGSQSRCGGDLGGCQVQVPLWLMAQPIPILSYDWVLVPTTMGESLGIQGKEVPDLPPSK